MLPSGSPWHLGSARLSLILCLVIAAAVTILRPARADEVTQPTQGQVEQTQVLTGHRGAAAAVAFSPDGRTLASGGADRTVRLWDLQSGECRKVLSGQAHEVTSVAFMPDGQQVAAGARNRVVLWSVESGEQTRTVETGRDVRAIAFTADGELLCCAGGYQISTFDTHTWEARGGYLGEGGLTISKGRTREQSHAAAAETMLARVLSGEFWEFHSIASSPRDRVVAVGTTRNKVILAAAPAGSWNDWPVLEAPEARRKNVIMAVAFSPHGTLLATGGSDGVVRLWQLAGGGATVLHGGQAGTHWKALTDHTRPVRSVCFSPSGDLLASASEDGTVRLWQTDTGEMRQVLSGHTGAVTSVAFSPDGVTLASAGTDGTVRLRSVMTR